MKKPIKKPRACSKPKKATPQWLMTLWELASLCFLCGLLGFVGYVAHDTFCPRILREDADLHTQKAIEQVAMECMAHQAPVVIEPSKPAQAYQLFDTYVIRENEEVVCGKTKIEGKVMRYCRPQLNATSGTPVYFMGSKRMPRVEE